MDLFAALTLALGAIGLVANTVLVLAIIFRTPSHMRVYSRILAASAACDLVGVGAMMLSCSKEKIFYAACILEFHGICSAISIDFCAAMFGVQEHMYTATCLLLNLSFAYRLFALDRDSGGNKTREFVIILIMIVIILPNSLLIPLYHRVVMRDDPMIEQYRADRRMSMDQAMGIIQYFDPYTFSVCTYSMLTSAIPFVASLKMKKQILLKMDDLTGSLSIASKAQHNMLVKALNMQLTVSAFFLAGCGLFLFNLVALNLIPGFPETTDIVVPFCNLQNVISAFSNLYVITPYRHFVTCYSSKTVIVTSMSLTNPAHDARSVHKSDKISASSSRL